MVTVKASGLIMDWPGGFSDNLDNHDWTVAHTYPRQEKRVIEYLRKGTVPGLAFFERRLRHYPKKGKQESIVPLLPGYLFLACDRGHHDALYESGRIVRLIAVRNSRELTQDLIKLITLVTTTKVPLVVRPELVPGKTVSITSGTFSGCSGVIVRRQSDLQLVVNLQILGSSVAVNLPASYAKLLNN